MAEKDYFCKHESNILLKLNKADKKTKPELEDSHRFSAFLSAFNLLNNSQYYSDTNFSSIVLSWSGTFAFLLLSWYVIAFLTEFIEKSDRKINLWERILIIVVSATILLLLFQ